MAVFASTLPVAQRAPRFHFHIAAALCATGFLGFAPTYWVPLFQGALQLPPLVHLHAALFYGWLLMHLRQSWLAGSGQIARHREWGMAGIALASGMCFVGIATGINSVHRSAAVSESAAEAARRFLIVPVTGAFVFAVLFGLAVVYVRKPEIHKRLLLCATASMLQAAIGRWFALFLAPNSVATGGVEPPPVVFTIAPGLLSNLFIIAGMIYDRRHRGSVHPAYWGALGFILFFQLIRVPLAPTTAWAKVTDWILAFAP